VALTGERERDEDDTGYGLADQVYAERWKRFREHTAEREVAGPKEGGEDKKDVRWDLQ